MNAASKKKSHHKGRTGDWPNTLWFAMSELGISSKEIQKRSNGGVSHTTVIRVKNQRFIPNVVVAREIARAIGWPMERVFWNPEAPKMEEPNVHTEESE